VLPDLADMETFDRLDPMAFDIVAGLHVAAADHLTSDGDVERVIIAQVDIDGGQRQWLALSTTQAMALGYLLAQATITQE
jgi:hypothetical protein